MNIFTTTGTRLTAWNSAKIALDKHMDCPPWRLHDLRRTAASCMARLNIAPHVVDKILNHSGGTIKGVAAVYNRYSYADERRTALDAWSRYVSNLLHPDNAVIQLRSRIISTCEKGDISIPNSHILQLSNRLSGDDIMRRFQIPNISSQITRIGEPSTYAFRSREPSPTNSTPDPLHSRSDR